MENINYTKQELKEFDELLPEVIKLFVEKQIASVAMTQRVFSVDKERATKIVDKIQSLGFISEPKGLRVRQVLITKEKFVEIFGD